jgi:hypothetical protein
VVTLVYRRAYQNKPVSTHAEPTVRKPLRELARVTDLLVKAVDVNVVVSYPMHFGELYRLECPVSLLGDVSLGSHIMSALILVEEDISVICVSKGIWCVPALRIIFLDFKVKL